MKTHNQIETALLNVGFTHLGARDSKPRGSPSGKEILSADAIGKNDQGNEKGETKMRHRTTTKPSIDRRIFARTGMRTKKINVSPKISRGGIRL